jgi:hypothetical protein
MRISSRVMTGASLLMSIASFFSSGAPRRIAGPTLPPHRARGKSRCHLHTKQPSGERPASH